MLASLLSNRSVKQPAYRRLSGCVSTAGTFSRDEETFGGAPVHFHRRDQDLKLTSRDVFPPSPPLRGWNGTQRWTFLIVQYLQNLLFFLVSLLFLERKKASVARLHHSNISWLLFWSGGSFFCSVTGSLCRDAALVKDWRFLGTFAADRHLSAAAGVLTL